MSLARKRKYLIVGISLIAFLVVAIGAAFAIHFGVSQYLMIKKSRSTGSAARVYNTTAVDMFGVAISYDTDESFDTCVGFLLTPHGALELSTDDFSGSRGSLEIISVPAAKGSKSSHLFGLRATGRHGHMDRPLDPVLFSFEDSAVADCVCSELSSFVLPAKLFAKFKIKC